MKKKLLAAVLSLTLAVTMMPAMAFADTEGNGSEDTNQQTQQEQQQNGSQTDSGNSGSTETGNTESAGEGTTENTDQNTNANQNTSGENTEGTDTTGGTETTDPEKNPEAQEPETPVVHNYVNTDTDFAFEIVQNKLDYRDVTIDVPKVADLISNTVADEIKIDFSMSYKKTETASYSITKKLADIDKETNTFTATLPYFGKYSADVSFLKNGTQVKSNDGITVGVAAEEYNIAMMPATTDVLIFSLRYVIEGSPETATAAKDPIPTIVMINRYNQYDWDKLPESMYRNPLLTESEMKSSMNWDYVQNASNNRMDRMVQYVKDLNSIHDGSKFNFFVNDHHIYSFPRLSYANGLKEGQYSLTLITDGSATYANFQTAYADKKDAQATHDQLVAEYKEFKENAISGKTTDYNTLKSGLIKNYAYAIVDAEDGQWWVVRKAADTFGLPDEAFQAKVLADTRISNNYINNLLASMQKSGNEEAFKKLYKFEDEAFEATRAKGKKIMMILGTSKTLETTYPVTDYVRFMVATMSNEYDFYYKGHPGNYTANSEENTTKYERMGIQMLEPSIAGELYLYYNPDIYLCGYESSLYTNASNEKSEEQDVALFRRTLETAKADPALKAYADFMDFTICDLTNAKDNFTYAYDTEWDAARPGMADAKKVANTTRTAILALVPTEEKNDRNYLVQYNNNSTKKVSDYDYAIWNSDKGIVHYVIQKDDGTLSLVTDDEETTDTTRLTSSNTKIYVASKKVYNGKAILPNVEVVTDGKVLKVGTDYVATYENNDKVGKATVEVTGIGSYKGTITKTFKILPKATTIAKLTKKKGAFTVKWKKPTGKVLKQTAGYQVRYSRDRHMNFSTMTTIKGKNKTKTTIKNLSKGKVYYVQVRTYKKSAGKTYYSTWSPVKKVKTKK